MALVSNIVSRVSYQPSGAGRTKRLSPSKHEASPRAPWREPKRRGDALFAERILPELSVLLDGIFRAVPHLDREEAVQDAVCQALEAFRTL